MKVYSTCARLKNLRESRNLNQISVAKYLNISQQTYSRYENGARELPICYLEPLARFYDVSADYLLGISMSKNDFISIAEQPFGDRTLQNVLDDIVTLNQEDIAVILAYIDFLKSRHDKS